MTILKPMKKYLLFYGDRYYPCGGWEDFRGSFDTFEDAYHLAEHIRSRRFPCGFWGHIVDRDNGLIQWTTCN